MVLRLTAIDEPRNPTPAGLRELRGANLLTGTFIVPREDIETVRLLVQDGWATLDFIGIASRDFFLTITEAGRRALAEAQREIEAPREQVA